MRREMKEKPMNDKAAEEITQALQEVAKELKAIRGLMESWDEEAEIDETDLDKYVI